MPDVVVRKLDGGEAGKVKLDANLFEAEVNQPAMHQALLRQLANARRGTASTKTRSEVRGGGRKPYRQKGTGRARQGSIRATQYAGGGVVFGPKPRSYAQDMPRKQRRLALRSALTVKAQEQRVLVVENLEFAEPRTRDFVAVLDGAGAVGSVLVAMENHNLNAEKSARNIPGVKIILTRNLNVRDVLDHDWLVLTRAGVEQLREELK
jgi:large subunit ribosomal protein L4